MEYVYRSRGHECLLLNHLSSPFCTRLLTDIENVLSEPDLIRDETEAVGGGAKSMLCVPVLDGNGSTIAVIQGMGKISKGNAHDSPAGSPSLKGFSNADVQVLKALASHISVSLQQMYEAEKEEGERSRLKDAIRIMKESGLNKGTDDNKRVARKLFPDD